MSRSSKKQLRNTFLVPVMLLFGLNGKLYSQDRNVQIVGTVSKGDIPVLIDNLSGLSATFVSTDRDDRYKDPWVAAPTNTLGQYSATVAPGTIDINISGQKMGTKGSRKYIVYLSGYTRIDNAPANAIEPVSSSVRGILTQVPGAGHARNKQIRVTAGTIQLVAFYVPLNISSRQTTPACAPQSPTQIPPGSPTHHGRLILRVLDSNNQPIVNFHVSSRDARTGQEALSVVFVNGMNITLLSTDDVGDFISIDAPGYLRETLLLYGRNGVAELYDSASQPIFTSIVLHPSPVATTPAALSLNEERTVGSERAVFIDHTSLNYLPLPLFRDPDYLLGLAPGYAPPLQTYATAGPSLSPGIGTSGSFSFNGIRSRENNFNVDGSDYNDEEFGVRRQGFSTPFPQSIESISEYRTISANADARYGRALGGNINALSRAAASRWQATMYGLSTVTSLSAKGFLNVDRNAYDPALRQSIPITTDGTLSGSPVQFSLNPSYAGPITTQNGFGYQSNPLTTSSPSHRMSAGFTVGGPVGPWGTKFFGSFELERQRGDSQSSFVVPTVAERGIADNGDKGGVTTTGQASYPSTLTGDAIFSLYPFPNNPLGSFGPNTFTAVLSNRATGYIGSARLDQSFKLLKHWDSTLTFRLNSTDDDTDLPSVGDAIDSAIKIKLRTPNLAIYLTTRFSARVFNTFRSSFSSSSADFEALPGSSWIPSDSVKSGPDAPFLLNAPLLVNVTTPSMNGAKYVGSVAYFGATENEEAIGGPLGEVKILGYSPVGSDVYHFPQTRDDYTSQFADTIALTTGKHVAYIGLDARSVILNSFEDRNARPLAQFSGALGDTSSISLAAAGLPTGVYQTLALSPESTIHLEQTQIDVFAQDYFRILPNLTIAGGLRMELGELPNANTRLNDAFNPTVFTQSLAEAANLCAPPNATTLETSMCQNYARSLGTAFGGSFREVFGSGIKGLTPRVGAAWSLPGGTTIRAGFGMYMTAFPTTIIDETRSAFDQFLPVNAARVTSTFSLPNSANPASLVNVFCPSNTPGCNYQLPLITDSLNQLAAGTNPVFTVAAHLLTLSPVLPTHLREPYSFQYNVSFERGITKGGTVNVAYVGTGGRHLLRMVTPLGGSGETIIDVTGVGSTANLFPLLGHFEPARPPVTPQEFVSTGSSSYDSLQLSFQQHLVHGIQGGTSLTYSHSIDDASDFFDSYGAFAIPANSLSPAERGNSGYNIPLRASGYFLWKIPGSKLQALTGGWHMSGLIFSQSGQSYTLNSSVDINQDGNATDRPVSTAGLNRHPDFSNRSIQLTIAKPLAEWAYPLSGQPSSSQIGRNTLMAPHQTNVDFALIKELGDLRVGHIAIRADVLNALNHTQFGIPVRILESPAFGKSGVTAHSARTIQLGIKLEY